MTRRAGSADLPLHGGHVPRWLADRMTRLGAVMSEAIVHHYGRDELLRRLANPFWFQSFGAVMGMDWHSSGITTSVIGALKRGLTPLHNELGIHVCGGRGKHSRDTPQELVAIGDRVGVDGTALRRSGRYLSASGRWRGSSWCWRRPRRGRPAGRPQRASGYRRPLSPCRCFRRGNRPARIPVASCAPPTSIAADASASFSTPVLGATINSIGTPRRCASSLPRSTVTPRGLPPASLTTNRADIFGANATPKRSLPVG